MSKTTLRKRIALTATTALFAGMLTVVATPTAYATTHKAAGTTGSNTQLDQGIDGNLYVATLPNTGSTAVVGGTAGSTGATTTIDDSALSKGLLAKDTSSGTAQTATVLVSGVLSLYAQVATASAFFTTGGAFSSPYGGAAGNTPYYNSTNTYVGIGTATTSTGVSVLWTAPATAGTYAVHLLTGFAADGSGGSVNPTAANALTPPTLSAAITVTVVAASAGGAYSAANSACETTQDLAAETSSTVTGVD